MKVHVLSNEVHGIVIGVFRTRKEAESAGKEYFAQHEEITYIRSFDLGVLEI